MFGFYELGLSNTLLKSCDTFLEFPPQCDKFDGPHPLECYDAVWKEVGCLDVGHKQIERLSLAEIGDLNSKNLRYITKLCLYKIPNILGLQSNR